MLGAVDVHSVAQCISWFIRWAGAGGRVQSVNDCCHRGSVFKASGFGLDGREHLEKMQ